MSEATTKPRSAGLGREGGRAVPAGHGQPSATLAGYVEDAIRERLVRDRVELNQGEDFPP